MVVSDPVQVIRCLFAFLHTICVLHVAVFGVYSYYMKKFKPGGVGADPAGRRVKILYKSVDIDTETYYYTITDTEKC